MSDKVILHVGTPKTGTSYLQHVLFTNQRKLRASGISYPAERHDGHFLAALDLMRLPWGGLEHEAIGAWDALAAEVRAWKGTSVISHEILATASRAQVGRALESVGHGAGAEVHVVLSVRDLVRQIPAEWQENVKHRASLSYRRFLDQIQDPAREGRIATWFWGVQEIPEILDRWGHDLPPERIHLVTVPPRHQSPTLLWDRFVEAFGLARIDLTLDDEHVNPSLGVPETALIRRINLAANDVLEPTDYRPLVRELLAHQTLSRRASSPRLALPPTLYPWASALQESWISEVKAQAYDVIGDLDDLRGEPVPSDFADPDAPVEEDVAGAAVDALKAVLLEAARLRREQARLEGELAERTRALDKAYLRPTYRFRERTVTRLNTSRVGRAALRVYRWLRGRGPLTG